MIVLASKSKARQKLLKDLGVKFKVVIPRVKEHLGSTKKPKDVVVANALLKAQDVAKRMKDGIVVACDTLIWQDNKVFGKPKNISDARAMLKKLSSKPHRLYSGIAVVDAKNKREWTGVEETKIEMYRLSDDDITRYFKRVSPLDMAGSFDIQGLGGLFIKRLEGCYYNVVGLPLSKMYSLLKKAGVSLLIVLAVFNFSGCATEFNVGTNKQDMMVYSTEQEVSMGNSIAKQVEKDYIVIQDPEMNARLQRIGENIANVCDRQELLYRFRIIEDKKDPDIVNAVSLPGGYIFVFKNLMKVASTDDELAAVMAHEIGHIVSRHSIKRLQAIWGYNILSILSVGTQNPDFAQGAQVAYVQLIMGYSQEDELNADKLGARYAKRAGYDPNAMITFLKKLEKRNRKEGPRELSYFKTHPNTANRVRATKEEMGQKISFEDYINTN